MTYQANFERTEMKFILSPTQYYKVLSQVKKRCRPDEYPSSTITSIYYDTPDHLLTGRSMESPVYKEKLRLRAYGDVTEQSTAYAEIKKKYEGIVYKRRTGLNLTDAERWLSGEKHRFSTQIEKEIDRFVRFYKNIAPSTLIAYERDSFFADEAGLRLTFDKNIRFRTEDLSLLSGSYGEALLPEGHVLLEAKAPGALPMWFVRLLSENGIRKTSFSKVGAAYEKTLYQQRNGGKKYA
ncbi:MAG: polyphosphate polymerase domain-containing protein [Clostridia bacterium]|nr:polyphosphate polymerase domain-containing protein [Clostridia bacterium]